MTQRFAILLLALAFIQCRADPTDDTVLLSSETATWFNSYGEQGPCEPQASSCTEVDNDKAFIDACVAAGHRAKTCGCSVKCSADIGYARTRPKTAEQRQEEDPDACKKADLSYIQQIKSTLGRTIELSDCIAGHVCQGNTVDCSAADAEVSSTLRDLARGNCGEEVRRTFCSASFVASFDCPDDIIATLSREWNAAYNEDDKQLRQCFQGFVCNQNETRCSDNLRDRAMLIRRALEDSRCGYWYRNFCRLDRDSDL